MTTIGELIRKPKYFLHSDIVGVINGLGQIPAVPRSSDWLVALLDARTRRLSLYEELEEGVDGFTRFDLGHQPSVGISARLSDSRYANRFKMTLAHELGHVLLHAAQVQAALEQLVLGSEQGLTSVSFEDQRCSKKDWQIEYQAWLFAGELLVPRRVLLDFVATYRNSNSVTGSISECSEEAKSLVQLASAHFEVSREAVRVQLANAKIFRAKDEQKGLFD